MSSATPTARGARAARGRALACVQRRRSAHPPSNAGARHRGAWDDARGVAARWARRGSSTPTPCTRTNQGTRSNPAGMTQKESSRDIRHEHHDIVGLIALGVIVLVLLATLNSAVNIVQQGQVGVVKRLGQYRNTHEPGLAVILPFADTLEIVDMREVPVPGDRQDVSRRTTCRHGERHHLHAGRRPEAGPFSVRTSTSRSTRSPDRAAFGDRHDDPRRGAVRARAHQHRRARADGGRDRQVGHPHQPDRDRRDLAAAADPRRARPAEAGRPGEAGEDP